MSKDDKVREHLASLLASGWSLAGYTAEDDTIDSDEDHVSVHRVLVQKEDSLRSYELRFEASEYIGGRELVLSVGKFK